MGRTRRRHTGFPPWWRSSLTGDGCSGNIHARRREAQNEARSRLGYAGFFLFFIFINCGGQVNRLGKLLIYRDFNAEAVTKTASFNLLCSSE